MSEKFFIEIGLIVLMAIGLIGYFDNRKKAGQNGKTLAIGLRGIQFLGVVFIVPTIIILGVEGEIQSETTATLLGALVGYLLAAIKIDKNDD